MLTDPQSNDRSGATASAVEPIRHFVELVTFRSKAGVTSELVISAAEQVNAFLTSQPGFVSRHLGLSVDGTWYDILYWESREHVMAAMANVELSPHCSTFFGLIDPAHDSMALFPSLVHLGSNYTVEQPVSASGRLQPEWLAARETNGSTPVR